MNEENGVLLADLAARRAEIRELRRAAFRSRSFGRWVNLVIHDQFGTIGTISGRQLWVRHPHVRTGTDLTFGERAADTMRAGFGSWTFVILFVIFLAGWMILNSALILGKSTYDHYPWILLNLMLSCLAALQGALILIAAKRADRVAAEANLNHYHQTDAIRTLQDEQMLMLAKIDEIHRHVTALTPRAGTFPPPPKSPDG